MSYKHVICEDVVRTSAGDLVCRDIHCGALRHSVSFEIIPVQVS